MAIAAPPSREGAALKGRRYVAEARLTVTEVRPGRVRAVCKGDGALYRLGWERGEWFCDCPARSTSCAHLVGLRLVVAPDL